jgi:hypothetical protein
MRESGSFGAWWNTLCKMGEEMRFQNIELWNRQNGRYVRKCLWNATEGKPMTGGTIKFRLPLNGNGAAECEIRASIWSDDYLEQGSRKAMLMSRLIDVFPPPVQVQETETDYKPVKAMLRHPTIDKKAENKKSTSTNLITIILHKVGYGRPEINNSSWIKD